MAPFLLVIVIPEKQKGQKHCSEDVIFTADLVELRVLLRARIARSKEVVL
jgi:hypothetical protein